MTGFVVCVVFYGLIFALCLWRPGAGRIAVGVLFLLMAFGVNGTFLLTDPSQFAALGSSSFLPAYRPLFQGIVGGAPVLCGLVAIAYETTAGLLILSRGRLSQIGLIMGIIFFIGSAPFGVETLANPLMALACQYLVTQKFGPPTFA